VTRKGDLIFSGARDKTAENKFVSFFVRGRSGGAPYKMTVAKLRLAIAAMGQQETKVGNLCKEIGIKRSTDTLLLMEAYEVMGRNS
jgi:hypothetical protein